MKKQLTLVEDKPQWALIAKLGGMTSVFYHSGVVRELGGDFLGKEIAPIIVDLRGSETTPRGVGPYGHLPRAGTPTADLLEEYIEQALECGATIHRYGKAAIEQGEKYQRENETAIRTRRLTAIQSVPRVDPTG